ncbi:ABC transporter substrate-binding protein [Devosia pacifica]|uniref:ABC transporter substrate-binding protein n=1 Tax=Devosia pacifica TaxID=1335967 RepID=A0A918VR66_9HYPH|nr:extracellular solute-binding protein [Devosia pacifica]GHA18020.1 ABC transporter substrate-binding protein [Devosia pacifica]
MKSLALALSTLSLLIAAALPAAAQDEILEPDVWHHATAAIGEPKYPEGFEHFDYVNVDAPKGGLVRLGEMGGFDTFNPVLPRGEAASGLGLVYETLMTPSMDEVLTDYGLLAEALRFPADYSSVTYRMNPDAHWHDGEPVTADDVIWSFEIQKELSPNIAQYYANVTDAEETAPGEVTFTFNETGNRELPKILGQLLVLPKHWWEGTNEDGEQRDIRSSTLEPPMGSGPYRLASFSPGQTVSYERVEDYWGLEHNTEIGQNNFGEIRYEYFLDLNVQFEAFKGDQLDWWSENQARRWATAYDFPAVEDGRVVRELFEQAYNGSGVMVGFVPNLRREKFQDPKVREALNYAFNFEELNRTMFFGQYERLDSYFYGLDNLRWSGLPEGEELELLEPLRDQIPEKVFTEEYANPTNEEAGGLRQNLRTALNLLNEAGYQLEGTQLVDEAGNQLSFEILLNGSTIEPVAASWAANLAQIGISATLRPVDSPQYINRLRSFDYDIIYSGWAQSSYPGNEQRYFFGSVTVDDPGAQNYAGIDNPAVDALIDDIIFADDYESLEAATRALDRVLINSHYIIPSYALRSSRIARWDRFSHPEPLPEYSVGFPSIWWYDEAKADETGRAQ